MRGRADTRRSYSKLAIIADVRYRLALVASYAVLAGSYFAGTQFVLDPRPRLLYEVWYSSGPGVGLVFLALAVGFAVGRSWALLGAVGPLVVGIPLQLSGHITPWHDPARPLDSAPDMSVLLACLTFFGVAARKRLGPRRPWATLAENWPRSP